MFRERFWPIHVAAAWGQARDVRLLLSAGAAADQKTSFGRRPGGVLENPHGVWRVFVCRVSRLLFGAFKVKSQKISFSVYPGYGPSLAVGGRWLVLSLGKGKPREVGMATQEETRLAYLFVGLTERESLYGKPPPPPPSKREWLWLKIVWYQNGTLVNGTKD